MIMCVLLCYPVSIRIYYQQGGLFLVLSILKYKFIKMYCSTDSMELVQIVTCTGRKFVQVATCTKSQLVHNRSIYVS